MMPIQDLLARVRCDPEFGAGFFVIGYYDRLAQMQITVPLERIRIEPGHGFTFEIAGEDGSIHAVLYHRVRNVWRNGQLIWHQHAPPA